ncbi:MAG: N-glycosylase/DNA lyase [Promethearchaeati archaeon]
MDDLISQIENLKINEIKSIVDQRIEEFAKFQDKHINQIFQELCFCIMTANCPADRCIEIHETIGEDFLTLSEEELSATFKDLGYRFPNVRANYITESRNYIKQLEDALISLRGDELRSWVVKNIKGLGYKESSHFLRNIGYKDYAIVDFHIVDLLERHELVRRPKTMTKKNYLQIEEVLKELGETLELNMAELDLYLWYLETGKILK